MKIISKTIENKITEYYLHFMFGIYLLFPGFDGYAAIADWKSRLFYIVGIAYVAIMLFFYVQKKVADKQRVSNLLKSFSLVTIFALVYLILTWMSALLSEYFPSTILGMTRNEGALTIAIYTLSFLFISKYGEFNDSLLKCIGISAIVFGIFSMLQFLGLNPLNMYPTGYNYYDANIAYYGQYIGSIGNADLVSSYTCPVSILLLISIYKYEKKTRIILVPAAALSIYIVFKLWVKSGLLAFAATLFLCLPLFLNLKQKDRKLLFRIIIVLIILSLVLVFFVDFNKGMFHELHQIMHGNFNPNYGTGRIKIWSAVLKLIPDRIILGYGTDTMIKAGIDPWEGFVNETDYVVSYIDVAHNEYLNVLYHQGILALAAYLGFIALPLVKVIMNKDYSKETVLLFMYVVAYLIQAFFNISNCMSSILFWSIFGLLVRRVVQ